MKRRASLGAIFPYIALVAVTSPLLIMYGWLVLSSFATRMEGIKPLGLTLRNWRFLTEALPHRPMVWYMVRNTFMFALSVASVELVIASSAGYVLSRVKFPGRRLFLSLTIILHAFPSVTLLIAIFFVLRALGLYDRLLGVILVKVALELPLGIWLMKGFFDTVSWDVEMAALVDGCTRFRIWLRIMLPLIKPGIAALAIFAFISGWNEFLLPYIFLPTSANQTLSVFLQGLSGDIGRVDYGLLTAVGLFYALPTLLFFIFTQRYLLRIYSGGVKG